MTSRIRSWSTSAASNNATPPYGAPEGSTFVNQLTDILRQIMAEVRAWWESPGWIDFGHTPTYSSSTIFTVTGNQTAIYEVGRRVRAINSTLTTIYGTITASAYSASTSVTVAWDSGSLDNTVAEVAVGAAGIANTWLSFTSLSGALSRPQLPAEAIFQTGMMQPFMGTTAPTGWILWFGTIGSAASGASNRANADTSALYTAIWNSFANTEAAVTGGRGVSAAADFAANKPIAIPDGRGCVVAVLDNLGGTAASRITSSNSGLDGTKIGARGGDERMHQHTHGITDPGHNHTVAANTSRQATAGSQTYATNDLSNTTMGTSLTATGITINNFGSGSSQNVQPTIMLPWIVKL